MEVLRSCADVDGRKGSLVVFAVEVTSSYMLSLISRLMPYTSIHVLMCSSSTMFYYYWDYYTINYYIEKSYFFYPLFFCSTPLWYCQKRTPRMDYQNCTVYNSMGFQSGNQTNHPVSRAISSPVLISTITFCWRYPHRQALVQCVRIVKIFSSHKSCFFSFLIALLLSYSTPEYKIALFPLSHLT